MTIRANFVEELIGFLISVAVFVYIILKFV
jgi:hypothetical protein